MSFKQINKRPAEGMQLTSINPHESLINKAKQMKQDFIDYRVHSAGDTPFQANNHYRNILLIFSRLGSRALLKYIRSI